MNDVYLADPRRFTMGQVCEIIAYYQHELPDYEIFMDGDMCGIVGRCKA